MSTRIDAPLFEATDDAVIIRPWETTLPFGNKPDGTSRHEISLLGIPCIIGTATNLSDEVYGFGLIFDNGYVIDVLLRPGMRANDVWAGVSIMDDEHLFPLPTRHLYDHTTLLALIRDVAQREEER